MSGLVDGVIITALVSMAAVEGPIDLGAPLADAEIDSLDLVELTQILEEECELSVPPNAFVDVVSAGDVIDVVRSHAA
ncbi:MAG TPA: acyl carrier protein [Solirubrobacterales bacterium]|nr:acyl carrier protein [Solirubrobacterales bacterium]